MEVYGLMKPAVVLEVSMRAAYSVMREGGDEDEVSRYMLQDVPQPVPASLGSAELERQAASVRGS
jgi:hypothetical protein